MFWIFPLLIFIVQSAERQEFQNNFSSSVPYHIQPWIYIYLLRDLEKKGGKHLPMYNVSIYNISSIYLANMWQVFKQFQSIYLKKGNKTKSTLEKLWEIMMSLNWIFHAKNTLTICVNQTIIHNSIGWFFYPM